MTQDSQGESAIVVGAGIIGIASAHYLSQAGINVTVIDRGVIAGACSDGNCGYICPSHVLPLTEPGAIRVAIKSLFAPDSPFRIKPRFSPPMWKWMWQFAKRCNHRQMLATGQHLKTILDSSIHEYRRLVTEERLLCEWRDDGLLYVLRTQRGMDAFAGTDRILSEHFGVKARRIESDELPVFEPALKPGLAGAFHYESDASVRPDRLNSHWAERLRQRGVDFVENCELRDIEQADGRIVRLRTDRGEMSADHVVFAVGAWSARLSRHLGCSIPVEPGKGYSVTTRRPSCCPRYPILFPEHKVGVSPFEDGYRIGSMMEFSGFDESIPERRIAQLYESAKAYLTTPHSAEEQNRWFGWRPMTWDSLPIIGRVPRFTNAYLATGHNMLGLSLATATGKLVAELIQGLPPHIDAAPFSPLRFQR